MVNIWSCAAVPQVPNQSNLPAASPPLLVLRLVRLSFSSLSSVAPSFCQCGESHLSQLIPIPSASEDSQESMWNVRGGAGQGKSVALPEGWSDGGHQLLGLPIRETESGPVPGSSSCGR